MLLKSLVALACVAIVAFVGFFFWQEYQARAADEERAAAASKCALNRRVAENAKAAGEDIPRHVRENLAFC